MPTSEMSTSFTFQPRSASHRECRPTPPATSSALPGATSFRNSDQALKRNGSGSSDVCEPSLYFLFQRVRSSCSTVINVQREHHCCLDYLSPSPCGGPPPTNAS